MTKKINLFFIIFLFFSFVVHASPPSSFNQPSQIEFVPDGAAKMFWYFDFTKKEAYWAWPNECKRLMSTRKWEIKNNFATVELYREDGGHWAQDTLLINNINNYQGHIESKSSTRRAGPSIFTGKINDCSKGFCIGPGLPNCN